MNSSAEIAFVERFVISNKQERCKYELSSKSKRRDFFEKLNTPFSVIDEALATPLSEGLADPDDLYKQLKELLPGIGKECYVMSVDPQYDGKTLPVKSVLSGLAFSGCPDIVIFSGGEFAFLGGHLSVGAPKRYILRGVRR